MNTSKRSFTLLEMLLVIALVGLTLGVVAIQAPKALKGETFESGIDQVKTRIALAEELMLNCQTDVQLTFEPEEQGKGLICKLKTDKPVPSRLTREIERHAHIKGVDRVEPRVLHFDGTLGASPKGTLLIKGGNREVILTLKGFPSHILRGDHVTEDSQATYPETVLSFI
ncbi:MAG: hypothetical protein S4CHLAM2_04850 [Chlamydiales bacterium]|nr:hypothetical protein [Chlamydiales bacterium]